MKQKHAFIVPLLLAGTTLGFTASCDKEPDTKYKVVDGEVVIDDKLLTKF